MALTVRVYISSLVGNICVFYGIPGVLNFFCLPFVCSLAPRIFKACDGLNSDFLGSALIFSLTICCLLQGSLKSVQGNLLVVGESVRGLGFIINVKKS